MNQTNNSPQAIMGNQKKFKLPTAFTILFLIIVVMAILTWILPAGQYDYTPDNKPIAGTYHTVEANPQGLGEIAMAPIQGFVDGIEIIVFILAIGGFLGIVLSTEALKNAIQISIAKLNNKEKWLIPLLMVFFAIGGSTFGMSEETLAFYPIIISAFLAAGYTSITGVSVILLGAGIGVIGSTTNPFATGIGSGFAGISIGDGILLRIIILTILAIIGIIFVMRYAEKHKTKRSNNATTNAKLTIKQKVVLLLFALTFIIMIYSVIPFEELGITFIPTFGWWFVELGTLFFIMSIITGLVFGFKESQVVEKFVVGAADMLSVVFVIGMSRGITIIMNNGLITDTILHYGEALLSNTHSIVFVLLTYILFLPISFLVPSTSGLATLTTPILVPIAEFAGVNPALIITIMQSASGLINLVTPTSAVVMGALTFGKITIEEWFKYVWKFLLLAFLLIGVILALAALL